MFCGITDPEKLEVTSFTLRLARCSPANTVLQLESARFEDAIISTSKENGRTGIVLLPNVRALIDKVRD
jgi:hypothetical protein